MTLSESIRPQVLLTLTILQKRVMSIVLQEVLHLKHTSHLYAEERIDLHHPQQLEVQILRYLLLVNQA